MNVSWWCCRGFTLGIYSCWGKRTQHTWISKAGRRPSPQSEVPTGPQRSSGWAARQERRSRAGPGSRAATPAPRVQPGAGRGHRHVTYCQSAAGAGRGCLPPRQQRQDLPTARLFQWTWGKTLPRDHTEPNICSGDAWNIEEVTCLVLVALDSVTKDLCTRTRLTVGL